MCHHISCNLTWIFPHECYTSIFEMVPIFFLNYVNGYKSVCSFFLLLLYMPIYWEMIVHMSQDKDQCSSTTKWLWEIVNKWIYSLKFKSFLLCGAPFQAFAW